MSKRIITIAREFGSGGRFIGESISKELGIGYYDRDIILKVAEETGFASDFIAEKGEYAPSKGFFSYAFAARDPVGTSIEDDLAEAQRKIILELAEKGPCVIIGRSADYILKAREDVIRVFIHAEMPEKLKRIMEIYHKTEKEATKMIHDMDKRRASNYRYYTEQEWGMAANYTICLDSSALGYEHCKEVLTSLYRSL